MSDYLGKKCVIIEFWADCCGNCTRFMTALEDFKQRNAFSDVEYLGLVCEWGVPYKRAVDYIVKNKITFSQIWIAKNSDQFTLKKSDKTKVAGLSEYSLPKRVFIDKSGRVIVEDREDLKDEEDIKKWLVDIILKCSNDEDNLM